MSFLSWLKLTPQEQFEVELATLKSKGGGHRVTKHERDTLKSRRRSRRNQGGHK